MKLNSTRYLFGLAVLAWSAGLLRAMDPIPEIRTSYGAVYRQVRILSINDDDVAISHAGGTTNVPANSFDLETLARAKMELKAKAEQKKKLEEKVAAQDDKIAKRPEQSPTSPAPVAADSKAPAKVAQPVPMKAPPRASAVSHDQQILKLKAAFPLKMTFGVPVAIIDKTSKDRGVVRARSDIINVDVPSVDVWNWYHGAFQTTTAASLPRTLELVDKKFREDLAAFPAIGGGTSARVQAEQSVQWFTQVLRPYIDQWRTLARQ